MDEIKHNIQVLLHYATCCKYEMSLKIPKGQS